MRARFRSAPFILGAFLLLNLVLVAARSAGAETAPGLYLSTGERAIDGIVYLFMEETTSIQANGNGEERIEFLVSNNSSTPIGAAEFSFNGFPSDYWGIQAWDEDGALDYSLVINGDQLHVTIHFRESVALNKQYRYFFTINFKGLAAPVGSEWVLEWGTYFPVQEFVRTVNLPGGNKITYVQPAPTEQTENYVRWVRYSIVEFVFSLRYTLSPLTNLELAEEFAPYFRMHPDDVYVPMNVNLALQHANCHPQSGGASQACSTALLGGSWLNLSDSYVDFHGYPGDGLNKANSSHQYYLNHIRSQADAAPVVYARVIPAMGGHIVIQYWLYYYYNAWGHQGGLPTSLHEGDWEMVQVVLDSSNQPLYAAYAQHFNVNFFGLKGASKKEWNDLARDTTKGDHPIVYAALGSHASYFGPYKFLANRDQAAPATKTLLKPAVYLLQPANDPWTSYAGKWGQPAGLTELLLFQGGPASPGRQGAKWSDPFVWSEYAIDWDEYAGHHSGKVRTHVDAPCNVGVWVLDTNERFGWVFNEYRDEIDGGEYIVNETAETRSLILHNTYELATWLYVLFYTCPTGATPSARESAEPVTVTVEFYDDSIDELVTAQFVLPAEWNPDATIASLTIESPAALQLEIDHDNDGDIDQVVPPESVETKPIMPPMQAGAWLFAPVVLSN